MQKQKIRFTVEEKRKTMLTSSDKNYLKGIFLSGIGTILTLLFLWGADYLTQKLFLGEDRIVGGIIHWGAILALGQTVLFTLYSIISWSIQWWREQKNNE